MYLHTRSGGNLFTLARLQVKTKVRKVQISEMLFANDAVLTAHTEGALKRFMRIWSQHQSQEDQHHWPRCQQLEVVEDFTYLGSTISRLHHLQQPVPTQRAEQTDWQTSSSTLSGTSQNEGLGQHHVDHQHRDRDVPGLRTKHAALRQ